MYAKNTFRHGERQVGAQTLTSYLPAFNTVTMSAPCLLDVSADIANHLFTFLPNVALPQALRLARCQAAGLVQKPVAYLPNENHILDRGISRGEASILAFNGKVVITLENLYSWR